MRRRVMLFASFVSVTALAAGLMAGCPGGTGTGGTGGGVFNLPPNVTLTATPTTGILPLTVSFSSSESTDDGLIVSRQWDFGDGSTSQQISPVHTYQTTGTFTVTLTITDDGNPPLSSTRTTTIQVTEAPIARIALNANSAEEAPATFSFDASGSEDPDGEVTAYRWEFGDGQSSTEVATDHTYSFPGTYRVRLIVTDDIGVQNTAFATIQVGINAPTTGFVTPSSAIKRLAVPTDAPLWVHANFDITAGVPYFVRAGLDKDTDPCQDQTVVYEAGSGDELYSPSVRGAHDDRVRAADFSPTAEGWLVTAGDDGTLRLTDSLGLWRGTFTTSPLSAVNDVDFSPDGSTFVYGTAGGQLVLQSSDPTTTGEVWSVAAAHPGGVNAVHFAPNNGVLASGGNDDAVKIWDSADGSLVRTLAGHTDDVTGIAFSPDGGAIASASLDGTVRVWEVATGDLLFTYEEHAGAVFDVAFSPDGTMLLSGGADGEALLWSASDGSTIRTFSGHTDDVLAVTFAPFGTRIATGSADGTARTWDWTSGDVQRVLERCGDLFALNPEFTPAPVVDVAFSADATRLAVAAAAGVDLQLDVPANYGNDLLLTTPQPLDVRGVTPGTYTLWVEIDTDRTDPQRSYATTDVQIIDPLTDTTAAAPVVELKDDQATVVVAPSTRRQVFDIGPVAEGDEIVMSFASLPGYGKYYNEIQVGGQGGNQGSEVDGAFSVMLLDDQNDLIAWFQDTVTIFSPDARIIVGQNRNGADNDHVYFVTDTATSVHVQVLRGVGLMPAKQKIYLDFEGGNDIWIGGTLYDIGSFNDPAAKTGIKSRLIQLLDGYNVEVTTTDDGPPPAPPYMRVYFDKAFPVPFTDPQEYYFGTTQYASPSFSGGDPRNFDPSGVAIVGSDGVEAEFGATNLGLKIGNATGYIVGQMLGLRRTSGADDIMNFDGVKAQIDSNTPSFTQGALYGNEQYNSPAIGTQNAPLMLEQTLGTAP